MEGSDRKRAHFSCDSPDREDAPRQKRPRFPKGKKESQGGCIGGKFEVEGGGGPIKSADPRVAAKERAVRRNQFTEQLLSSEDTSLLNDVTGAEEEYEDDADEDEDGILIEPFNLNQEREEGYFDAEGNYVEYKNDGQIKDAWLESAKVDTRLAEKHLKRYAEEEQAETDLSSKELAVIKKRIADVLQPRETVLQALRRLKGTSTEMDRHHRTKMSDQTKALFDQLTEDAMKLLYDGDYNVYHEKKETFQREAEGYQSLLCTRAAHSFCDGSTGSSSSTRQVEDIFADAEDSDITVAADQLPETTSVTFKAIPVVSDPLRRSENSIQFLPERDERGSSTDMFADGDGGGVVGTIDSFPSSDILHTGDELSGGVSEGNSEYTYDESSGFYYNYTLGYYYDPNSGLFCSSASGKWYRYVEESNAYIEVDGESEKGVEPTTADQP